MSKVVPSQVVSLIDQIYPNAKQTPNFQVYSADAAVLAAIIDLVDDIPEELITISGEDYTDLVFGLEAMGSAIERWNQRGGDDPPRTHRGKSPVVIVRDALLKCPDQRPSHQTAELQFIADAGLKDSIRLDIDSAASSLHRGDFKAATVLAGSAVEALLLWAIQQRGVTSAPPGLQSNPRGSPDNWTLPQYIEVAEHLAILKQDTATQARLAKDFRNLIHPGRVQRTSQACDRGAALSALAAVEHVVRDLVNSAVANTP